jgi:hypothetical protein
MISAAFSAASLGFDHGDQERCIVDGRGKRAARDACETRIGNPPADRALALRCDEGGTHEGLRLGCRADVRRQNALGTSIEQPCYEAQLQAGHTHEGCDIGMQGGSADLCCAVDREGAVLQVHVETVIADRFGQGDDVHRPRHANGEAEGGLAGLQPLLEDVLAHPCLPLLLAQALFHKQPCMEAHICIRRSTEKYNGGFFRLSIQDRQPRSHRPSNGSTS